MVVLRWPHSVYYGSSRYICDLFMTLFVDICFDTPRMQLPLLPCYAMTDDGEHCHDKCTLQRPRMRPIIACGDRRICNPRNAGPVTAC